MAKFLAVVCCLLALGTPVFAGEDNDAKAFTAVGTADEESSQDFVQTVQWGGRGRVWTCIARGHGGCRAKV